METLINSLAEQVVEIFKTKIRNLFPTVEKFNWEMSLLAKQVLQQEGYGGYIPCKIRFSKECEWLWAGGMSEFVISNTMYFLGISTAKTINHQKMVGVEEIARLYPKVLVTAMKLDPELDLFVRSAITGATNRGQNFKSQDECDLLKQLQQESGDSLLIT
jgi:hypothetical protein